MTACPNPTKARYATQGAAETAAARTALRTGLPMRPYECACTWWHLTKTPAEIIPEPSSASQVAIERLNSIPDIDFREIVAADVRNNGDRDERAALRHPRNLKRWQRQLGELIRDIEQQLHDRRDDKSLAGVDWRKRGLDHREQLTKRITECRRRRSEVHVEMTRRQDSRRRDAETAAAMGATAKELRVHAGELAVDRLIKAHRDEFNGYLTEEYRAFGLEIPDRFQQWTRQPESANPASTVVHRPQEGTAA
jgi:hypothetical protein